MPSGVKVKEVEIGQGTIADRKSLVVVGVRGYLKRGEKILDSAEFPVPFKIDLKKRECIAGLQKGIVGMREGGKRELIVSPHLGYGSAGVPGRIPANAALRFEVELLQVRERGLIYPEDYPGGEQLLVFSPGEAASNTPRWQFCLIRKGRAGGIVTRVVPGGSWRHAQERSVAVEFSELEKDEIFRSVREAWEQYPIECLKHGEVWADSSEQANSITRSQRTDEACVNVAIWHLGELVLNYNLPKSSPVLAEAKFFREIAKTLEPYLRP